MQQQIIEIKNPALSQLQLRVALVTLLTPIIGAIAAIYWAINHSLSATTFIRATLLE